MRGVLIVLGIILVAAGVLMAAGLAFQVAPTPSSVIAWEHVVSGGVFYDGAFPVTQSFVPTRNTTHSGMSFRLYFSGSGTRSISYTVKCGGLDRGAGSGSYSPSASTGETYLTVTATSSAGVTATGSSCALTITVTGSGVHYWVRDSQSRIAVVWGEPYTAPPPPAPPTPPSSTQPPSGVGETGAAGPPLPPVLEATIGALTGGDRQAAVVLGIILAVVGLVFLIAAFRVG